MHKVSIEAFPRIHLGLISMHKDAPRSNGGAGFSIAGPSTLIVAHESERLSLEDKRAYPMAQAELSDLKVALSSFISDYNLRRAASIKITGEMRTHIGMGSATAIRLGAIECLAALNEVNLSTNALVVASRRGGTSGIGVNVYFSGGFVCDLGRRASNSNFLPSSRADPTFAPLALPRLELGDWPLVLAVPRSIVPKTQEEEVAFFRQTAPLSKLATFEASYVAFFQLYAAAAELDYASFCRGVNDMQKTDWKVAERREYGRSLQHISDELHKGGADCVGMSSLGPMLFAFSDRERCDALAKVALSLDCDVFQTKPLSRGRILSFSYA